MTACRRGVSWFRELERTEGDASDTTGFGGSRRCQDCFPPSLGSTLFPVSFTLRKALGTWRPGQTQIYILSVKQLPWKEGASILVVAANSQTWLLAHSEPITGARRAGYGINLPEPCAPPGLGMRRGSPQRSTELQSHTKEGEMDTRQEQIPQH